MRRELERLRQLSDRDRHLTILWAPNFLLTDGRPLMTGSLQKIVPSLEWFIGDQVQACMLSMHLGEAFYVEARLCGTLDATPMQLVSGAGPVYPPLAKAEGLEGEVVVRYGVSVDGRVIDARVERADPEGVFEDAALSAVRSWRYNPAVREGKPVAVDNVVSTVRFELTANDRYRDD